MLLLTGPTDRDAVIVHRINAVLEPTLTAVRFPSPANTVGHPLALRLTFPGAVFNVIVSIRRNVRPTIVHVLLSWTIVP